MKIIPLGWATPWAQSREWCAAVLFIGMSKFAHLLTVWWHFLVFFKLFITACKHLNLPNVWSWHTYTRSRAPILCHLLTNSSRQYHLLLHFIKQILITKRWLNWVRMWPTNLYRVLKWRQMKPISLWDTDLQIHLSVLSWDILYVIAFLLFSFVHVVFCI